MKSKITDSQLCAMLAEAELHRLLDLLKAPPGDFVVKRLRDYLHEQGVFTAEQCQVRCDCGWVRYRNEPCRHPQHGN